MTKDLTLKVDDFGRQALQRFARRGGSAAKAVRTASLYYLAEREADRPAWKVPDFAAEAKPGQSVIVELDDATWSALREEAGAQGVAVETLALHAVMYFLADVDSGRIAVKLEDAIDMADR
ncbi:MAG: hypothetical protein ABWY65_02015 [Thermoleophilaceae bacterium]